MKTKLSAISILAAAFIISAGGQAFARNAGQGTGQRLRDGSCVTAPASSTSTQTKIMQQDRLRDGSCLTQAAAASSAQQGQGRQLGAGDGTGVAPRPLDGTGFGSPAAKK